MPDKKQGIETFEDSFVDQAWSEMNALLDQEKPVLSNGNSSGRMTYGGLAILFFLFGLFSGAMLYSLTDLDRDSDLQNKQRELPAISTLSSDIDFHVSTIQEDQLAMPDVSVPSYESSFYNDFAFGQSISYTTDDFVTKDISLKPLDSSPSKFPYSEKVEKLMGSVHLNTEPKYDLTHNKLLKERSAKPDPAIGLKTGINVMRDNIFAGYYGGLIAQYPVSGAILVNTGLLYTSLQPEESIRYATSSLGSTTNKKSSSYAILEEMEYISLPIGLSFQPFQFLRFSSGVNVSYLLNSESYYSSLADNPYAQGRENNVSLAFRENSWNNLDVSMVYGLTLFPTQNWGVDFSYNVGMMDFSKNRLMNVDDNDKHNFYQISIMYYFLHK